MLIFWACPCERYTFAYAHKDTPKKLKPNFFRTTLCVKCKVVFKIQRFFG
ncbi:MAG: hypothetical protein NZ455_00145 [Bacteroidia bacterium]|nr:hypothetical protein [Bacteroidia bacterium]MDW8347267.1 hypothetical protein [Bacteroidia bacterium]